MMHVSSNFQKKITKEKLNSSNLPQKTGFTSTPTKPISRIVKEAQSLAVSDSFRNTNSFIKNWDKWLGLATALTSTVGFAVGGVALMYDDIYKKRKHKKEHAETKNNSQIDTNNASAQKDKTASNVSFQGNKTKDTHKKEEMGHINPETAFGKIGLAFAKVGIAFSGIAGIFNGIAMKLPLMAFGEGVNVAASPIINTPAGFGLFSMGLAGVFAGRALENNPALKLNTAVLASKTLNEKVKYLASNTWLTIKELGKSTKTTFTHLFNLVNPAKSKISANFFRDKIIAVKSSTLQFNQSVLADGSKIAEAAIKSHPYRMHTASVILAVGGAILTIASFIKNKIGQKTGFKTSEVGGALDNIGLAYSGLEKLQMGSKASGAALAVSGVTILAGTPQAETERGRALQWIGCGLLFAAFVFERKHDLSKALAAMKNIKETGLAKESSQLIRQLEIDLPDAFSRKELKKILNPLAKFIKGGQKEKIAAEARNALMNNQAGSKIVKFIDSVSEESRADIIRFLGNDSKIAEKTRKIMEDNPAGTEIVKFFDSISKEHTKNIIDLLGGDKEAVAAREILENNPTGKAAVNFIDSMLEHLSTGKYEPSTFKNPETQEGSNIVATLVQDLQKDGVHSQVANNVRFISEAKDPKAVAQAIIFENSKMFGENYKTELQKISDDSSTPAAFREAAQEALKK
ncbi:MAG: hypothetical protein WCG23_01310 [bacterium]